MGSIFGRQLAPHGIGVWNPSFDVTPFPLIKGIINEVGVAESATKGGIIDLPAFLKAKGYDSYCSNAVVPVDSTIGFKRMTEADIAVYVASLGGKVQTILGTTDISELAVNEVGDGNLNFVYIIKSNITGQSVVAKQALPYVRCVGESWPLTLDRAIFETNALIAEKELAPEFVPEVFHFDKKLFLTGNISKSVQFQFMSLFKFMAIIVIVVIVVIVVTYGGCYGYFFNSVMEFVNAPNIILRKHFIQGNKIYGFADHLSTFVANTLFGSSGLSLTGSELRTRISAWSKNTAMCALTEQVIFSDPYIVAKFNHWTAPQLDDFAARIREDTLLKLSASSLKAKFLGNAQALLHGDLHSGSVMAAEGSTFVIDPEFAFYGPMGFDIGALLSNFFLAYFSQSGYTDRGADYGEYLLSQIEIFYSSFEAKFIALWNDSNARGVVGELFPSTLFSGSLLILAQKQYLRELFWDSLGFAGMKMIRRIVGIAHVADLESIADAQIRSVCEKRALLLGRELVVLSNISIPMSHSSREECQSITWILNRARQLNSTEDAGLLWPETI